jgi:UDP-N-acetylglucosamine 1-carboxyvinyltransferase
MSELKKMGAEVTVDGKTAVIEGVPFLTGAPVAACDLRAGAAVVIAGLAARGETVVEDIVYIERGYQDLVGKLRSLGADIACVTEPDEFTAAIV